MPAWHISGWVFEGREVVLCSFPRSLTATGEAGRVAPSCGWRSSYTAVRSLVAFWLHGPAAGALLKCREVSYTLNLHDLEHGWRRTYCPPAGNFPQHTKWSPYNSSPRFSHMVGEVVNNCTGTAGRSAPWDVQSTGDSSNPKEATSW